MLSHGDELGRSQLGNNNAYCQDNELTWIDWSLDYDKVRLLEFVKRVFAFRRRGAGAAWRSPAGIRAADLCLEVCCPLLRYLDLGQRLADDRRRLEAGGARSFWPAAW